MHLGVDLDNTIVAYDQLFYELAIEKKVVPATLPATKLAVRGHLRAAGQENVWTELQGDAYGVRMASARPYPGCLAVLRRIVAVGIEVSIVSHRTRAPYRGTACDLHQAAARWLEEQGIVAARGVGLPPDRVYFELSKEAKCRRIRALRCTHFIDDLPEILAHPDFPETAVRILFDPDDAHPADATVVRVGTWHEIDALLRIPGEDA